MDGDSEFLRHQRASVQNPRGHTSSSAVQNPSCESHVSKTSPRGNCSTWRMSNCNWRQCQIDFSFPLGWFLGIKPAGRLLEKNLPNWSYLQSIFYARCCLRKNESQQTVVLVCSLKRADFYIKKRKLRFAAFLRCTESVCSQTMLQKIMWKEQVGIQEVNKYPVTKTYCVIERLLQLPLILKN